MFSQGELIDNSLFQIRSELFDHGLLPPPSKFSLINLVSLMTSLSELCSDKNNTISSTQFKALCMKHIANLTQRDIEIYFLMIQLLDNERSAQPQKSSNRFSMQADKMEIPSFTGLQQVAIYLFLQLYSSQALRSSNLNIVDKKAKEMNWNVQYNESVKGFAGSQSPMNSPRSKALRVMTFAGETSQILQFVKLNLKTIFKLASQELNQEQVQLNEKIFKSIITFLFDVDERVLQSEIQKIFSVGKKMPIDKLSEWIDCTMGMNEIGSNTYQLQGLTRSVTNKGIECANSHLKISYCEDSYIFVDASVQTLLIQNVINSQIYVAAVEKVCTIDKCENITVCLISQLIKIGNSIDSKVFYYGPNSPVLYGDCRGLTLGPHSANSVNLIQQCQNAKIELNSKFSSNFASPYLWNNNININYSVLPLKDFSPLILPNSFLNVPYMLAKEPIETILSNKSLLEKINEDGKNQQQNNNTNNKTEKILIPLLAPLEFKHSILQKFKSFGEFQNNIKQQKLTNEQVKNLELSIQDLFKEWMNSTGQTKPIADLVKLIYQSD